MNLLLNLFKIYFSNVHKTLWTKSKVENIPKLHLPPSFSFHRSNARSFIFNSQCHRTFSWWTPVFKTLSSFYRILSLLIRSSLFRVPAKTLKFLAVQEFSYFFVLQIICFFQQMIALILEWFYKTLWFLEVRYSLTLSWEFYYKVN